MAYRIGIVGSPNTGKSYSRTTLREPEKTFVISPSQKMTYLKDSSGKALPPADIKFKVQGREFSYRTNVIENREDTPLNFLLGILKERDLSKFQDFQVIGNHIVVKTLEELSAWTHVVNRFRKDIHTLILPDFTHYISTIIGSKSFISRKAGGEAFQRFWELAGDALNAYFTNIDNLRDEMIVVTEFHSEYVEVEDSFRIFVPAGKMLQEKFLPDSYYDILLYTRVLSEEECKKLADRFKFIVNRSGRYPGRSGGAFPDEVEIPNNLQFVLDRVRETIGI